MYDGIWVDYRNMRVSGGVGGKENMILEEKKKWVLGIEIVRVG